MLTYWHPQQKKKKTSRWERATRKLVNKQMEKRRNAQLDRKEETTCEALEPGKGWGYVTSWIIECQVATIWRTRKHHVGQ